MNKVLVLALALGHVNAGNTTKKGHPFLRPSPQLDLSNHNSTAASSSLNHPHPPNGEAAATLYCPTEKDMITGEGGSVEFSSSGWTIHGSFDDCDHDS
jgi:hypothetical protein